jgi:hypothetical protein
MNLRETFVPPPPWLHTAPHHPATHTHTHTPWWNPSSPHTLRHFILPLSYREGKKFLSYQPPVAHPPLPDRKGRIFLITFRICWCISAASAVEGREGIALCCSVCINEIHIKTVSLPRLWNRRQQHLLRALKLRINLCNQGSVTFWWVFWSFPWLIRRTEETYGNLMRKVSIVAEECPIVNWNIPRITAAAASKHNKPSLILLELALITIWFMWLFTNSEPKVSPE